MQQINTLREYKKFPSVLLQKLTILLKIFTPTGSKIKGIKLNIKIN
jgi:hypothetical protein